MLGVLLSIIAALCWGTMVVLARMGMQRIKPTTATLISLVSSVALLGLLALIINFDDIVSLSLTTLLWFGLIGFITYGLGRHFSYFGIRYIGVARATPISASSPLFAIILAIIFIGESVNLPIVIGTLCIVGGLFLLITGE